MAHENAHADSHRSGGADALNSGASFTRYEEVWQEFTVTYNDAGGAKITVQDGDIVNGMYLEVTETWDGNGTVNLGDGENAAGFWADADMDKGNPGYKSTDPSDRGVYLWNPAGRSCCRMYTGADTIDATVVAGTSSQGAMKVYVRILRLK